MIAIELEGLRHRSGLMLRPALLRWDDVARVEQGATVGADGTRVELPAGLVDEVQRIVRGPEIAGTLPQVAQAFAGYLAGPHGPRIAARRLVDAAGALGASDVHLEATPSGAAIRLRLEGELVPFLEIGADGARSIGAALKGLAGCLPYRSDIAQEGRIAREGVCADVRASFVPAAMGERIALRLFGRLFCLDDLGMPPVALQALRAALDSRTGLLVVAGASGSGKTTTLYAALAHVAASRKGAHLSLEDPVEQRLRVAGIPVDQIELDPARGLTAEAMLVAALRQDVDVLGVGEIRTAAEARLALEAAHTGRLVLAGLHAGSATEARQRLVELGADEALLGSTLRGVLFQQLVARPCGCAVPATCPKCRGAGRRRELVAELSAPACTGLRGVA
jgi:type II secretory ATPase GspE/PulE/Tfp pilus assembly ATPase PilB-like protein